MMNIDKNNPPQNIPSNKTQRNKHIKKIIHLHKVGFILDMQECSINENICDMPN